MTNEYNPQDYRGPTPPTAPAPRQPLPEEPKQRSKLGKALPYALVAGASLLIGGIAGAASGTGDNTAKDDTVQGLEAAPDVETVEVETVVDECLVALTHADNAIEIYSEGLTLAADALVAYEAGDYAEMDEKTQRINDLQGELTNTLTGYYLNSDDCRGQQ